MRIVRMVAVAMLLMLPKVMVAQVAGLKASEITENCRDAIRGEGSDTPERMFKSNSCVAVAVAFLQLSALVVNRAPGHEQYALPNVCLPDGVSARQILSVFVKYSDDHPEKQHMPYTWMMLIALQEAFPCAN